jgi:hypothetical protein
MRTLFTVLILSLASITFAQESRFSISASIGPSISLRKLAARITNERRAQLAGNGLALQGGMSYRLNRRWGITARANYDDNETRTEAIRDIITADYNLTDVTAEANNWAAASVLIGPSLGWEWGRVGIEGRLMGGYAYVRSPQFKITGKLGGAEAIVETQSRTAGGIAAGAGGTMSIGLLQWLSLVFNVDAVYSTAEFKDIPTKLTFGGRDAQLFQTEKQSVGVLNVTAGLRLSF